MDARRRELRRRVRAARAWARWRRLRASLGFRGLVLVVVVTIGAALAVFIFDGAFHE